MKKNKNQNQYGTFHLKKSFWSQTKKYFSYAVLVIMLIVAGVFWLQQKAANKKIQEAQVASTSSSDIPDWWYRQYFGSGVCQQESCQQSSDPDQDGLTNSQELFYHTNPLQADTNNNGSTDGADVAAGFDPSRPGQQKFTDIETSDTPLLESMVFDKDIFQMAGDMATLNNMQPPAVTDAELKISSDNSADSIGLYLQQSNDILAQYMPQDSSTFIQQAATAQSQDSITQITSAVLDAVTDLKNLSVPSDAVMIQKYQIGMLQLLPTIMMMPTDAQASDLTDTQANKWYDDVRQFSYFYQQLGIETTKLQNKYSQLQ
jgi:hypothetical protein